MQIHSHAFKPARGQDWTPERIERLQTPDVQQLRENADKLGATAVVALCDKALAARPAATARRAGGSVLPKKARNLVSRQKAFQARGVYVNDAESGWAGIRKSDEAVVMSLWAGAVRSDDKGCSQLLWAPNVDGARPWSDTVGGKERLRHCKLALAAGRAEGLLVHGVHQDGEAAEHNARTVYGVDPECVVHFQVEQRGDEYWAVWGGRAAERSL